METLIESYPDNHFRIHTWAGIFRTDLEPPALAFSFGRGVRMRSRSSAIGGRFPWYGGITYVPIGEQTYSNI